MILNCRGRWRSAEAAGKDRRGGGSAGAAVAGPVRRSQNQGIRASLLGTVFSFLDTIFVPSLYKNRAKNTSKNVYFCSFLIPFLTILI